MRCLFKWSCFTAAKPHMVKWHYPCGWGHRVNCSRLHETGNRSRHWMFHRKFTTSLKRLCFILLACFPALKLLCIYFLQVPTDVTVVWPRLPLYVCLKWGLWTGHEVGLVPWMFWWPVHYCIVFRAMHAGNFQDEIWQLAQESSNNLVLCIKISC